jgi:cell division protein FtsZ
VVVGTVIDAEMANQIRVTVVATGLGKPVPVARTSPQTVQANAHAAPPLTMRVVRQRTPYSPTDYAMLDKPTVQRQRAVGDGLRAEVDSEDLLDIPAFLRRQAD